MKKTSDILIHLVLCVAALGLIYFEGGSDKIIFQRVYIDRDSMEGQVHVFMRYLAYFGLFFYNFYFLIKKTFEKNQNDLEGLK